MSRGNSQLSAGLNWFYCRVQGDPRSAVTRQDLYREPSPEPKGIGGGAWVPSNGQICSEAGEAVTELCSWLCPAADTHHLPCCAVAKRSDEWSGGW